MQICKTGPFMCLVNFVAAATLCFAADTAAPRDARSSQLAAELRSKGWIAYSAMSDQDDWDLFLIRPDGAGRQNITKSPESHELGPRFSPNGQKILFRRLSKTTKVNHNTWGTLGQLMVANADGTKAEALGGEGELPWATWSPEGSQLACLTKTGIEIRDLASRKILRKIDRQGIYQQLSWSPDGQWLTGPANTYGESWTVVRMNAATGKVNPVSKFQNCTPDWFPDSKRLIYSSRPADQGDDGGLSQASGQKPQYGWTQLWMANGDGSHRQLIYGEDGRHVYGGDISPDGKYVLFTTESKDGGMVDAFIHVMRLADAPTIAGKSPALRKRHPHTKDGPVLRLALGWEPHWSYRNIAGLK